MSDSKSYTGVRNTEVEPLSLRAFFNVCLSKWIWFVISLIIFVGAGILYIACQEPVYERSEQILIKSQDSGSSISNSVTNSFSTLGLFANNSNVQNELISITSPAVMAEVINRLDLRINYVTKKKLRDVTLYGKTLPIKVLMPEIGEPEGASMKCLLNPDGSIKLWKFKEWTIEDKRSFDEEISGHIGRTVNTPLGKITVLPNEAYQGQPVDKPIEMDITKKAFQTTIEDYCDELKGDLVDEFADVIDLTIRDVNAERAVAILNEMVSVYNSDYIEDKNKIAKATSAFINERLSVIERELGSVDKDIADYSSSKEILDPEIQGKAMVEKMAEYEKDIVAVSTELEIAKYVEGYLNDPAHKNSVMPASVGLESTEMESQISTYNELLLMRNSLVSNSSESNPLVKDYDLQLEGMRSALRKGLANRILYLQTTLNTAKDQQTKLTSKLKSTPKESLPLLSDVRQQKVKESLYLFLLEKREENELTQKFTADNTRLITPPTGSLKPVSPKKIFILAFCLLLAVGVPVVIIYFKITGDTKVRSRKDLEKLRMPFAGEIPQVGKAPRKINLSSKKKINLRDEKAPLTVVKDGNRDIVNEAFRVIRSNVEFMSKGDSGCHVIMITSFNPGSGKSFVSYNLALAFAIKKKRVLLIDCDLRHGSSSMYVGLPAHGLTTYLSSDTPNWENLIIKSPDNPYLDVLPIGKIPPNPAELLENGRLNQLIEELRKDYDYIFLDCPPVNIVVDTQIVGKYADSTLFIVRSGLLDRSLLGELDSFYGEHKFHRMSLILNGTAEEHSRYHTYGSYHNYVDS